MKIPAHTITLKVQTTLSESGLRVMAEELAKLAETVPSAAHALTYRSMSEAYTAQADLAMPTAKITGDRTNTPRDGAHSTLMVKFSDGTEAGPFGYYADAYRHACESGVLPRYITRNGSKARAA